MGVGKKSGQVLLFMQLILFLCGAASCAFGAYYLFGNVDTSVLLPNFVLYVFIGFGVFLLLMSTMGCFGTRYALRDLKANHDNAINAHDFDTGRCRRSFNCFVVFLTIFFLLHAAIAILALSSSSSIRKASGFSVDILGINEDFSESILENIHKKYASKKDGFQDSEWVGTQNYFDCCGYDRDHPELMTGRECVFPSKNKNTSHVYLDNQGRTCKKGDAKNGCRKHSVGGLKDEALSDTCSDHFEVLFKRVGWISLGFAVFELLAILASCCLCVGSRTGKDVPEQFDGREMNEQRVKYLH